MSTPKPPPRRSVGDRPPRKSDRSGAKSRPPRAAASEPRAASAPADEGKRSAARYADQRSELLAALQTPVEKVGVAANYRIALALNAVAVLVMPLLYLGLLALVGYAAWWLWLRGQYGGGWVMLVLSVICGITLVFLIRPLLSRPPEFKRPAKLKRDAEPFLFEYVEAICDAVGAPRPKEIRVDLEMNASASLSSGLWSLAGRDLTLTIGLPLAAGMTVRQFTGVLAHEFGHFSQGYGMKASWIIRNINAWFHRAAFQRDSWDAAIAGLSAALPLRLGIVVYALRLFIWLSRQLITFIFLIGHGISCHLLRMMEYDADRYEIRLAGTPNFVATSRKFPPLTVAHGMGMNDVSELYQEGQLADEFPKLVVSNVPRIDPATQKAIREHEEKAKTKWYDSHPTSRDRIAAARSLNEPGALRISEATGRLPASILFDDFRRVSRAVTKRFYKGVLGDEFDPKKLRRADQMVANREAEYQARRSLARYFQVTLPMLRPLRLAEDVGQPPDDPMALVEGLKAAREQMVPLAESYKTLAECLSAAESEWLLAAEASALSQAGMRFKGRKYHTKTHYKKDVTKRLEVTSNAVENLSIAMLSFEDYAENRLSAALRLLQVPKICDRIPGGEDTRLELMQLYGDARAIGEFIGRLPELRSAHRKLGALLEHYDGQPRPALHRLIETQLFAIHGELERLRERLVHHTYPFGEENHSVTFAEFALPFVPPPDHVALLMFTLFHLAERLAEVQVRIFAKLAHAAEQVETAIGLPKLPEPKDGSE